MAKTNFKTIDEYNGTFKGEVLERLVIIRSTILDLVPNAEESISYQIPAMKLGKKTYLIHYCGFPNHISLSSPWTERFLKEFEEDLKEYKVSKSVIQFPNDRPLPLRLIQNIILYRLKEIKGGSG